MRTFARVPGYLHAVFGAVAASIALVSPGLLGAGCSEFVKPELPGETPYSVSEVVFPEGLKLDPKPLKQFLAVRANAFLIPGQPYNPWRQAEDRKRWEALNTRFHEVLLSGRESPWTLHALRLLSRHGERYRRCSIGLPNTGRDVHAEHRELFELAMAGNEPRAALALEAHIRATPDLILRALDSGTLQFKSS